MLNAIVLAAGLSRRMGSENKLTLPLEDKTIVSTVVCNLSQSNVDQITVVVGHEHKLITEALINYRQVKIVFNSLYEIGQMTSIKAGISSLDAKCKGFLICLGDMPSITAEDYNVLLDQYKSTLSKTATPIIRPIYEDRVGHPVLFHHTYKKAIEKAPDESECKMIIGQNIDHYYPSKINSDNYFLDIDNKEAYNRLVQYNP